ATRTNDRDLAIEIDERLENGLAAAQRLPGGRHLVRPCHRDLALAVVAERGRLEDGRTSYFPHGCFEIPCLANRRERRDRQPMFDEKGLLANAMLRDCQGSTVRTDDGMLLRLGDGCGRNVFELERDDIDAAGERAHGVEVVVRRVDL